jgi:hypothetical protein
MGVAMGEKLRLQKITEKIFCISFICYIVFIKGNRSLHPVEKFSRHVGVPMCSDSVLRQDNIRLFVWEVCLVLQNEQGAVIRKVCDTMLGEVMGREVWFVIFLRT